MYAWKSLQDVGIIQVIMILSDFCLVTGLEEKKRSV